MPSNTAVLLGQLIRNNVSDQVTRVHVPAGELFHKIERTGVTILADKIECSSRKNSSVSDIWMRGMPKSVHQ